MWLEKKLGELISYQQPGKYIVKSTNYKTVGTPVLTAGKTFILGHTDELTGVYNVSENVILFDDFTTSSKFVDFDFKVKSSAIKILTNDVQSTDLKFLFEKISSLEKMPDNHQRQWIGNFSKQVIQVPSFPEQQKIGQLSKQLDTRISNEQSKIKHLKSQKQGLLQKML